MSLSLSLAWMVGKRSEWCQGCFREFLACVVAPWGALGGPGGAFGAPWVVLGSAFGLLGLLERVLGGSLGTLWRPGWVSLGCSWWRLGESFRFWVALGTVSGKFREIPGAILAPFWSDFLMIFRDIFRLRFLSDFLIDFAWIFKEFSKVF